ncbi:MAG: hypothetical protein VX641_04885 [Planctomycetota bacterium]|nr:hypothetical protein [Planctomycetota bacterium]
MTTIPITLALLFAASSSNSVPGEEFLGEPVQLTTGKQFTKAGEAYFSPDGKRVIFQAVEVPVEGEEAEPFYGMYLGDFIQGAAGPSLENIRRVSPPGSANTCGWFDPEDPDVLWFASTVHPPTESESPGYQRSGRYKWMFPPQMRVVKLDLETYDGNPDSLEVVAGDGTSYVAECSVSEDGRYLLYCSLESGQGDIFVKDLASGEVIPIVTAPGYDGGPFFSPDGKRICYRSDRHNNNYLQLFVGELAFDSDGNITGLSREHQVTDNAHVNWAPFWHPNGRYLVYASSEVGHRNYEVFIVDAVDDASLTPRATRYGTARRRVTDRPGADVLPVFDATGRMMMWTSQMGETGTSQLWVAPFIAESEPVSAGAGAS